MPTSTPTLRMARMVDLRAADAHARERALAVTQGFIVQAPAGAGKTELLTRRYLALLATVDEPESILAITFTRKAAAEMRERIVGALRAVHAPDPAKPLHARTLELARAALEADAAGSCSGSRGDCASRPSMP
jgi:ATP-dependent exoDNAse (exonuclease V) beta subunit